MRQLYDYLKTKENNPLKKMQALIVISKKVHGITDTEKETPENRGNLPI